MTTITTFPDAEKEINNLQSKLDAVMEKNKQLTRYFFGGAVLVAIFLYRLFNQNDKIRDALTEHGEAIGGLEVKAYPKGE